MSISANDAPLALAGSRVSMILVILPSTLKLTVKSKQVFLTGLALQLFSFLIFTCIFVLFLYRVRKYQYEIYLKDQALVWYKDWRALAGTMIVSCIGILVRPAISVKILTASNNWLCRFVRYTERSNSRKASKDASLPPSHFSTDSIHSRYSSRSRFIFRSGREGLYHHSQTRQRSRTRKR